MPLKIDRYVINVFPFKKKCAKKKFSISRRCRQFIVGLREGKSYRSDSTYQGFAIGQRALTLLRGKVAKFWPEE